MFGFAFEIDGGGILYGTGDLTGSWASNPTIVANLGTSTQSIALAPGDGGLLLAVGTPSQIAVYPVVCP
jgi:hypothetical protein